MRSLNKPSYHYWLIATVAMTLLGMIVPAAKAGASAAPPSIAVAPGGSGTSTLTAPDFDDPRSGEQQNGEGPVYYWNIEKTDGASPCHFIVLNPDLDGYQNLGQDAHSTHYQHITLEAGRTTAGISKVVISVTAHWNTAPNTGTVPDSTSPPLTVPVKAGDMVLTASKSLAKVHDSVTLTATLQGADNSTMVTFHYRDSSGNDVALDPKSLDNGIATVTLPDVNHPTWPGNLVGKYRFWITTNEPTKFPPPTGGDGNPAGDPMSNEADVTWGNVNLDIQNLTQARKTNPGAYIAVNSNDSNGNHKPDTQDISMSVNDPDLVPMKLKYLPADLKHGTLTLSATAGSSHIKIWTDQKKNGPITLPKTWHLSQIQDGTFPKTLYIEGVKASSSPRDTNLELSLTPSSGNSGSAIKDDVKITVTGVKLVAMPSGLAAGSGGRIPICFKIMGTNKARIKGARVTTNFNGSGAHHNSIIINKYLRGGNYVWAQPAAKPNGSTNTYTLFVPMPSKTYSPHLVSNIDYSVEVKYKLHGVVLDTTSKIVHPKYYLDPSVQVVDIGVVTDVDPLGGIERTAQHSATPYFHQTDTAPHGYWYVRNNNNVMHQFTTPTKAKWVDVENGYKFIRMRDYTDPSDFILHAVYDNDSDLNDNLAVQYFWAGTNEEYAETLRNEVIQEQHGVTYVNYYGLKKVGSIGKVVDIRYNRGNATAVLFPGSMGTFSVSDKNGDSETFKPTQSLVLGLHFLAGVSLVLGQPEFTAAAEYLVTLGTAADSAAEAYSLLGSGGIEGGKLTCTVA